MTTHERQIIAACVWAGGEFRSRETAEGGKARSTQTYIAPSNVYRVSKAAADAMRTFNLTYSIRDDVTKEALFGHEPGPFAAIFEVERLQRLQEMPAQELETDVHLFFLSKHRRGMEGNTKRKRQLAGRHARNEGISNRDTARKRTRGWMEGNALCGREEDNLRDIEKLRGLGIQRTKIVKDGERVFSGGGAMEKNLSMMRTLNCCLW